MTEGLPGAAEGQQAAGHPESGAESLCPRPCPPGLQSTPNKSSTGRGLWPSSCLVLVPTRRPALQAKAVELEHEMFRNAKAANLYKASVLKKVGRVGAGGARCGWGGRGSPCTLRAACPPRGPECALYPLLTRGPLKQGDPNFPPLPAGGISSQPHEDYNLSSVQLPAAMGHRSPLRESLGWGLSGARGATSSPPVSASGG